MATAMRVAGDEEGEGNKAMAMATRIEGEWTATSTNRAMVTATKRMMAKATAVAGDKEGNGDGGKSNGMVTAMREANGKTIYKRYLVPRSPDDNWSCMIFPNESHHSGTLLSGGR
jgi:hypothetical protein